MHHHKHTTLRLLQRYSASRARPSRLLTVPRAFMSSGSEGDTVLKKAKNLKIWGPLFGALFGSGVLFSTYQAYQTTESGCADKWATCFTEGLLPENFSESRFLMFPRDTKQLQQELDRPGLFQVVIGPSDSGKTWTYFLTLKGRKNSIYLSLRGSSARSAEDFIKNIAHQIGNFPHEPQLETFVAGFKKAVAAVQKNGGPPPLIVIDDPQGCFLRASPDQATGAERFFAELVNLSKVGMLNVVFLSSTHEVVAKLKDLSGYSDRLSVKNHPYISPDVIQATLAEEMAKTRPQEDALQSAKKIVDKVGSHLGNVNRVLEAWATTTDATAVDTTLNDIIMEAHNHLRSVLFDDDQRLSSTEFVVASVVLEQLAYDDAKDQRKEQLMEDNLVKLLAKDKPYISAASIIATKTKLLRREVLRDVDGSALSLHSQALSHAFPILQKSSIYERALADAKAEAKKLEQGGKESSVV